MKGGRSSIVGRPVQLVGFGDRQYGVDDVRLFLQLSLQAAQRDSHLRLGGVAHQVDAGDQEQLLGADEHQPDETHLRHLRQLLETGYRGLP